MSDDRLTRPADLSEIVGLTMPAAPLPPLAPPTLDELLEVVRRGERPTEDERLVRHLSDEQRAILDRESRDYAWRRWAAAIGVPTRLIDASCRPNLQPTHGLARSRQFMEQDFADGRCLILMGSTGVGKSLAAVMALRKAGYGKHRFYYFPALCGALLDPESRTEAKEAAKTVRFAVFDDFGTEYVKEGGLVDAFLDEIVWYRESHYLPTIITTNLDVEGLKKRLPERLVDRLRGDWGRAFECPGGSLR